MSIPCINCITLPICISKAENSEFRYSRLVRECSLLEDFFEGTDDRNLLELYATQFVDIFHDGNYEKYK